MATQEGRLIYFRWTVRMLRGQNRTVPTQAQEIKDPHPALCADPSHEGEGQDLPLNLFPILPIYSVTDPTGLRPFLLSLSRQQS